MENSSSISKALPRNKFFIYWIAAVGALGGLLFGYDTGVISGALLFITEEFHINTVMQELVVSSVVLGALIGAMFSGRIADHFGRRRTLMLAAIAFVVGTFFATAATEVSFMIAGRFIVGLAIGICSYTAPLFISEMAPAEFRGFLVLINAIAITGGEALAFLVDYFLTPAHAWRWMFAAGLVPAVALYIGMLRLPETPRWLVSKGLTEKAHEILVRIRNNSNVINELNDIKQSFSLKAAHWKQLFSKTIRPVLWIGIFLGIFQQFFGINTVMYYGPTIFKALGMHSTSSQMLATFGMGLVNMIISAVCMLLVDKVGRRKLLLFGSLLAAISLILVGHCLNNISVSPVYQWVALCSLVTYITGYCISVGSLFWLMIAEIFPLSIRGLGMSIATAIQWAANFIVSMTFLNILHAIGPAQTFWLYAAICLVCLVYCYFWVPETRGVPLEQIEKNLGTKKPSRQLGLPIKPILQPLMRVNLR